MAVVSFGAWERKTLKNTKLNSELKFDTWN